MKRFLLILLFFFSFGPTCTMAYFCLLHLFFIHKSGSFFRNMTIIEGVKQRGMGQCSLLAGKVRFRPQGQQHHVVDYFAQARLQFHPPGIIVPRIQCNPFVSFLSQKRLAGKEIVRNSSNFV